MYLSTIAKFVSTLSLFKVSLNQTLNLKEIKFNAQIEYLLELFAINFKK